VLASGKCGVGVEVKFFKKSQILLAKGLFFVQFPPPPARKRRLEPTSFQHKHFIMAVALRLTRQGSADRPYYKIIAVDSRVRRDGRFIEQLGTYDPMKEGVNYDIDLAAADKWLGTGAKPSETVKSIIRKARTAAAK
jgi:small subunit ribosomal protein S16